MSTYPSSDWWLIGSSALWIAGLAILVAVHSYHGWLASETHRRLPDQFKTRGWVIPFALGMTLFCTGLAVSRHAPWWERTLWGAAAFSSLWRAAGQLQPVLERRTENDAHSQRPR